MGDPEQTLSLIIIFIYKNNNEVASRGLIELFLVFFGCGSVNVSSKNTDNSEYFIEYSKPY